MFFRPRALLVAVVFLALLALAVTKQAALVVFAILAGVALEVMMWRGVFSRR